MKAELFHWIELEGMDEETKDLFLSKLGDELESWDRTPYRIGMQRKGMGVDCIRFVCAILDHMRGFSLGAPETLPNDASMHTREGALKVMRRIRRDYMPNEPIYDGSLEPGDVIVVGPSGGGPGHALIVGHRKNEIWHSTGRRVKRTGLQFTDRNHREIFRVYRATNKACWARS